MGHREGERWGWILGWSGAFLWLLLLGGFWFFKDEWIAGISAWILVVLAEGAVFFFAPWRHPQTRYWKVLLPLYGVFGAGLMLAIRFSEPGAVALEGWSYLWVLPMLLPFFIVGSKTWDSGATNDSQE